MSQPPYYPPPQHQPQYPSPYGQYGAHAYVDPLAPAKRASILMFVIGGLLLLCGLCFTGVAMVPMDQLPPESTQRFQEIEQQLQGMSVKTLLIALGLGGLVPGILFIAMGFFVRGGGIGAVITSIVLTSAMILLLVLSVIGSLAGSLSGRGQASGNPCVLFVPLALFVLLLIWLIQAARAVPHVASARQQYAAQYYHYQQQQQAYQQQQPPFPPQAPPPPPSSNP